MGWHPFGENAYLGPLTPLKFMYVEVVRPFRPKNMRGTSFERNFRWGEQAENAQEVVNPKGANGPAPNEQFGSL
jgi:hypothetical protein